MPRPTVLALSLLLALPALAAAPAAFAQTSPQAPVYAASKTPYPGTIAIDVDATNLSQRIFQVKQKIPVQQTGPMTLLLPKWLPGSHADYGRVDKIAGLEISANGKRLEWVRDPLDVFAFKVDVPAGATQLDVAFQFLSPTDNMQGRVVMTPAMLNLQWIAMSLYPAGYDASAITFAPTVKYPAGWQAATALETQARAGDTVTYKPVNFEVLADSPIYAGKYFKTYDLDPNGPVPVRLNVVADDAKYLEAKPDHLQAHRNLVQQMYKLYGAHHYDHYDFLFSLSSQMSGNGLEHQRSSENGVGPKYFTSWDPKTGSSDLLAHEFNHSWDGKYRRGADLATPNFNTPMQGSLLWVYEGQTQYWGNVITARAGLRTFDTAKDALALVAANYADNRPGLEWRALQDTTNDPIVAKRLPKAYRSWQLSEDYYSGGQMIWLETDALLRQKSGGKHSLDDFAKKFFGINNGDWKVNPYTFDDVVATLNSIEPYDWNTFLRDRLDGRKPLTGGIEASGWKLVYKDKPNAYAKAAQAEYGGGADFLYSLGLSVGKDSTVSDVRWDSPAFKAGIGPGMTIVAVNDRAYSGEILEDAVKAAKDSKQPITLLVKEFDLFRTIKLSYFDGLKYPHLERIEGKPDLLTPIYAPKK
ncbi:peptidase M61 [Lysobacter helvus]|uniref:Peptidase M61 n=2 Tax=Lysobacteraceae TaxID=32033 RepID=A0ABM7Q4S2_9GAMM|nr:MULTISPECIES: M61 family peptidase [Lysobacter]BCT92310.1 peptidase M61 [Lysobacter caseinilyticus]BCT95463.1 peptidase M61 [Lysobacter helvus]